MGDFIRKVRIELPVKARQAVARQTLLPKIIAGVSIEFIAIKDGAMIEVEPQKGKSSILLFVRGDGVIDCGGRRFSVDDLAVLVPGSYGLTLNAAASDLHVLQISLMLDQEDERLLGKFQHKYPYFTRYSQCPAYTEDIKSDKTVSRMLVPEDVVPRLSIGSVQTTGPDEVGAHKHPFLEQLFFGLEGNYCIVFADGHETEFEQHMLLHIPLASRHGVRVQQGNVLHYLWIDVFMKQEDMSYITEAHVLDEP